MFRTLRSSLFFGFTKSFSFKSFQQIIQKFKPNGQTIQAAGFLTAVQHVFNPIPTDDKNDDTAIVLTVKKGLLAQKRFQYDKAENYFHEALKLYDEQNEQDKNALHKINLYLYMANLYYEIKDFKKSFRLFQECLRQLLANHSYENNNEAVIEISLKISNIFASIANEHDAKTGYDFCVQSTLSRIRQYELKAAGDVKSEDKEALLNAKVLYVMVLQTYGRYLCSLTEYPQAVALFEPARILAEQILSEKYEKLGTLYNDFALAHYGVGNYEAAIELLKTGMDYLSKENELIKSEQTRVDDKHDEIELKRRLYDLNEYQFTNAANTCSTFYALKEYTNASEFCVKALDIYKRNQKNFDVSMKNEIGEVRRLLKDIKKEQQS